MNRSTWNAGVHVSLLLEKFTYKTCIYGERGVGVFPMAVMGLTKT